MNDLHKWVLSAAGVLVAIVYVLSALGMVGGNSQSSEVVGGSSDSGWNATGDGCISVDGTCIIDASGNVDGAITSSNGTFSGTLSVTGTSTVGVLDASEFTQGGGIATLTDANGGAYTLTQTELLNNNVLAFAASGAGQEVIQLTFPASSSLSAIIPNAGDQRIWLYDASALAAATTTTITAGTGMDIIAVTTNDDVIDGAEWSQITCWRQADTDITCLVSELLHAD